MTHAHATAVQNYHRLKVSAKAMDLTVLVYEVTRGFPASELFGMTDQMRRAAKGIGLAIAEGCGRSTNRETIRYFVIANGSAQELEFAAEQSIRLGFARVDRLELITAQPVELQKMLCSLIKRLHNR